jgi:hypothetical protein
MILELDRLSFRVRLVIVFRRDWTPPDARWPEKTRLKLSIKNDVIKNDTLKQKKIRCNRSLKRDVCLGRKKCRSRE